jgi:hypothetical protein
MQLISHNSWQQTTQLHELISRFPESKDYNMYQIIQWTDTPKFPAAYIHVVSSAEQLKTVDLHQIDW